MPQLLKSAHLEPVLRNKRSHRNEKPAHLNEEEPPFVATRESLRAATKTQRSQKKKKKVKIIIIIIISLALGPISFQRDLATNEERLGHLITTFPRQPRFLNPTSMSHGVSFP